MSGFIRILNFWMSFLNLNQLPAAKKGLKKRESQQKFVPSYFVMALGILPKDRDLLQFMERLSDFV